MKFWGGMAAHTQQHIPRPPSTLKEGNQCIRSQWITFHIYAICAHITFICNKKARTAFLHLYTEAFYPQDYVSVLYINSRLKEPHTQFLRGPDIIIEHTWTQYCSYNARPCILASIHGFWMVYSTSWMEAAITLLGESFFLTHWNAPLGPTSFWHKFFIRWKLWNGQLVSLFSSLFYNFSPCPNSLSPSICSF